LWVGLFAGACQRAVRDATLFEERVQQIQSEWRTRLGSVRANSAADLLIKSIAGAPVLTVGGAAGGRLRNRPEGMPPLMWASDPDMQLHAHHAERDGREKERAQSRRYGASPGRLTCPAGPRKNR
jgi:hypothetical protein